MGNTEWFDTIFFGGIGYLAASVYLSGDELNGILITAIGLVFSLSDR